MHYLSIITLEEPMVVVVVAAVAVVVVVTVTVVVVADVDQSRTHAHSSLAHSFIGVSLISPGTWSAIPSATLVSVAEIDLVFFPDCPTLDPSANFPWEGRPFVSHGKFAEGSGVGRSGKKTKSILATLTKVADEMADQVPGETKDTRNERVS